MHEKHILESGHFETTQGGIKRFETCGLRTPLLLAFKALVTTGLDIPKVGVVSLAGPGWALLKPGLACVEELVE